MLTDAIKQQILSLAIRGKLTDQRPEDGTAEELYRSILAEKKRFIKAGKLKKEKPLPPIVEEEIPFDIPKNWKWVRLGEIFTPINGRAFKPSDWSQEGFPIVRIQNLNDTNAPFNYCNFEVEEKYNLYGGELLFGWSGTPGTSFGAHIWQNRRAVLNQHIFKMEFDEQLLSKRFLKYVLNVRVSLLIEKAHGAAGLRHVTKGVFEATTLPLPPLAEQERIASKLEAIMTALQDLDTAQQRAQSIKRELRKSLLQEAIQGKLTDQRPEDGSAEDLYRSILAEKKRLIKAGKLKKEKPLPPIEEKDIPFDIPENWKWVRLGEITTYAQSKEKIEPSDISPETWSLDLEDIEKDSGRILVRNLAKERKITGSKNIFHKGELLYSKLRPYLKKILIAPEDGVCTPELVNFSAYNGISHSYLVQFLRSPYVDNLVNGKTYGVKMPRTNTETMCNLPIPLPPPAEQERIVAKLEELLPLCD